MTWPPTPFLTQSPRVSSDHLGLPIFCSQSESHLLSVQYLTLLTILSLGPMIPSWIFNTYLAISGFFLINSFTFSFQSQYSSFSFKHLSNPVISMQMIPKSIISSPDLSSVPLF